MNAGPPSKVEIADLPAEWRSRITMLDRLRNFLAICVGNKIVYINPAGASLLGLTSSEPAVDQSFFSFVHHDYAELAELGLSIFADESSVVSIKLVRLDGGVVDVELSVSAFDSEDSYIVEALDITDHLKAARALRAREQRLEGIINTVADGIITLDDNGVIQTFNPAAESIFGFRKEEVIGRNIRSLIPDGGQSEAEREVETDSGWVRVLSTGINLVGKRKDGGTIPLEMAVRELQQGEELSFTGIVRDISARKAEEERVFHMAHHDALTQLPNRHLFNDRVEEAYKRARRHNEKMAILFVDLDRFKPINDTLGHAVGDEVLKEVSQRLRSARRATDTVARVGGDEFTVLLEELRNVNEVEDVRARLEKLISEPLPCANGMQVGASIGIAVYPDHATTVQDLMDHADRDMYSRKHAGRAA